MGLSGVNTHCEQVLFAVSHALQLPSDWKQAPKSPSNAACEHAPCAVAIGGYSTTGPDTPTLLGMQAAGAEAAALWVKQEIDGWLEVAGIEKGPIFRRVLANGRVGKDALTERAVWQLVREYAAQIGIGELAPHDLRRTAAKLCRSKGGELEQIKFLLGHESILTTERYLGSDQDLKNAVNDALVFE